MPNPRHLVPAALLAALVLAAPGAGAALAEITEITASAAPAPTAAGAEPRLEDQPGYVPFSELAILPHQDLKVEINLEGALLQMIAGTAGGDDPELARLLGGLRSIRVQVASLKEGNAAAIHARMEQTAAWLDQHGWKTIVKAQQKNEEDFLYVREAGGAIVGLTVLTFQAGDEAAVVNIVGHIDPAQIGRLSRGLHLPGLDRVPGAPPAP